MLMMPKKQLTLRKKFLGIDEINRDLEEKKSYDIRD